MALEASAKKETPTGQSDSVAKKTLKVRKIQLKCL